MSSHLFITLSLLTLVQYFQYEKTHDERILGLEQKSGKQNNTSYT